MRPKQRNGQTLALILLVLFVLTSTIAIFQYLAVQATLTSKITLQLEDSDHRAEGLIRLLASRWKKQLQYSAIVPVTSPASGTETGVWDSRPYVLGWEREQLDKIPPSYRVSLWISFTDDSPRRTLRYDLKLFTPSALYPRVFSITGFGVDPLDPTDTAARQAAFRRNVPTTDAATAREANVEVLSRRIEALAAADLPPATVIASLQMSALAPAIARLKDYLVQYGSLLEEVLPAARLSRARGLLAVVNTLADEDRSIWEDLARFVLSRELVRSAEPLAGANRTSAFQEALDNLGLILNKGEHCCGVVMAAWRRAQILIQMRSVLTDPALLAAAKATAAADLKTVTDRSPKGPIHERTDITREELPGFLDTLWRARVAAAVQIGPSSHLLVSILQDGTKPVIHLETAAPVKPLAWHADGSQIYAVSGAPGKTQSAWRLALDGTEIEQLFANPFADLDGQVHLSFEDLLYLEEAPGGQAYGASGKVYDSSTKTSVPNLIRSVVFSGGVQGQLTTANGTRHLGAYVFSPEGDRVVEIRTTASHGELYLFQVADVFASNRPPYVRYCKCGENPFADISQYKGFGWRRYGTAEWLGFVIMNDNNALVHFVNTALPAMSPTNPTIVTVNGRMGDYRGNALHDTGRDGTLVTSPDGLVFAGADRLHFVPLPGSTVAAAEWPVNMLGTLSEIHYLSCPPWGGVLFFAADQNGARKGFALDLATGIAQVLTGPGGTFPAAIASDRLAVSPIPGN